jgi:protein-tyrosine phosphatase
MENDFPFVRLEGASNFRDAGGQVTSTGASVRRGILYRGNRLSGLTEADFVRLERLGIATVYDFRAEHERVKAPIRWAGPTLKSWIDPAAANTWGERVSAYPRTAEGAGAIMTDMYAALPFELAPKIADIVRALAGGGGPCVVACSAGKDRTGVAVAVLLALLAVPRTAIEHDYLLSRQSTAMQSDQMAAFARAAGHSGVAGLPVDALSVLYSVEPAFLDAAFGAIESRHGSVEAYAQSEMGLGDTELAAYSRAMIDQ